MAVFFGAAAVQLGQNGIGKSQVEPSKKKVAVTCCISSPQVGQNVALRKLDLSRKFRTDRTTSLLDDIAGGGN